MGALQVLLMGRSWTWHSLFLRQHLSINGSFPQEPAALNLLTLGSVFCFNFCIKCWNGKEVQIYGQMGVRYWWLGSYKFFGKIYLKLHNVKVVCIDNILNTFSIAVQISTNILAALEVWRGTTLLTCTQNEWKSNEGSEGQMWENTAVLWGGGAWCWLCPHVPPRHRGGKLRGAAHLENRKWKRKWDQKRVCGPWPFMHKSWRSELQGFSVIQLVLLFCCYTKESAQRD